MMQGHTTISRSKILRLTWISEGALLLIALLWIGASGHTIALTPTPWTLIIALAIYLPLMALNLWLWSNRSRYPPLAEFLNQYIIPLCADLDLRAITIVALLSGIAEELFFRGALLLELSRWLGLGGAVCASGIIFGYAHFIGSAQRAPAMVALYILVGIYLGAAFALCGDLIALMIAHALFNFSSMIFLRYRIIPRERLR